MCDVYRSITITLLSRVPFRVAWKALANYSCLRLYFTVIRVALFQMLRCHHFLQTCQKNKYIYTSRLRTFFVVFFNLFQRGVSQIIVRNYKLYTNGSFAFASGNEDGEQLALCRCAVRQMMHDKKG